MFFSVLIAAIQSAHIKSSDNRNSAAGLALRRKAAIISLRNKRGVNDDASDIIIQAQKVIKNVGFSECKRLYGQKVCRMASLRSRRSGPRLDRKKLKKKTAIQNRFVDNYPSNFEILTRSGQNQRREENKREDENEKDDENEIEDENEREKKTKNDKKVNSLLNFQQFPLIF